MALLRFLFDFERSSLLDGGDRSGSGVHNTIL